MSDMSPLTSFYESDFNFAFSKVQRILVFKIGKYVNMPFIDVKRILLQWPGLDIQFVYFPLYRFLQAYLNIYLIWKEDSGFKTKMTFRCFISALQSWIYIFFSV